MADNKTSQLARITAILAIVSGAAITFSAIVYGQSLVIQQAEAPFIGGGFWPVEVLAVAAMLVLLAFFGGAFILGIIDSITPPRIFGHAKYTVLGVGGLIGVVAGLVVTYLFTIDALGAYQDALPEETGESMLALGLLALSLGFVFLQLVRPTAKPTFETSTESGGEEIDEETIKKKRVTTPNPDRAPSFEEMRRVTRGTDEQDSGSDAPEPDPTPEPESQRQELNHGELKFDWRTETDVSMDDVGGMENLKREIERDIIKPMTTDREKAKALDIPLPNIIFHGPPGTGKTFMAKALATELGLPFVQLSGADVTSKYVNQTQQEINDLFTEAEQVARQEDGAVVFLDELDSVLKKRDDSGGRSHEEDKKAVNEFLNHLENTGDNNVVFIGATNRLDALDEAGIRRGRIDKKIKVGKPDVEARREIINAQLANRANSLSEHHIKEFAERTEGLVAADIEGVIVDAARASAFDRDSDVIEWADVEPILNNQAKQSSQ